MDKENEMKQDKEIPTGQGKLNDEETRYLEQWMEKAEQEEDPDEAFAIYQETETIYLYRGILLDQRLGGLYGRMMMAALDAGNRKEALYCGKRAVEIYEQLNGYERECAVSYTNLGQVYLSYPGLDPDRLEAAMENLKKGEEMFPSEDVEDPRYRANLTMQDRVRQIFKEMESFYN